MSIAAFVVSAIAILIALGSLRYTMRAARRAVQAEERAQRAELRETRREDREIAEVAKRRRGDPVVEAQSVSGGPTANPVRHEYMVRNVGEATIGALWLWVELGGEQVSSLAGWYQSSLAGGTTVVLTPNGAGVAMGVDVPQPLRSGELRLMVKWRDAEGEHERFTGIYPPRHA